MLLSLFFSAFGFAYPSGPDFRMLNGERLFVLGENRFNVYDPTWNEGALDEDAYIARMAREGMSALRIFVFTDCEDESRADRVQPGCIEPQVGVFDEAAVARYDRLFKAAEAHGIHIVLTLFAIGFTPGADTWKSWADNPYNRTHGGPAKTPVEFFTQPAAREAAKGRVRFLASRYAQSPQLLSVDLLNEPEWDGEIAESVWMPWAEEMAAEWSSNDVYGHPITVGSVGLHHNIGGDERPWYANPANDVVQWHLYGREIYEVHGMAFEMTRKIEETRGYGKPVLVGEFGYGGEDPHEFDHTHTGIWAAAMGNAGVLAHSAPQFNIDSDIPMTAERAHHFTVLHRALDALVHEKTLQSSHHKRADGVEEYVLAGEENSVFWWLAPEQGYRAQRSLDVDLSALPSGHYRVQLIEDVSGEVLTTLHATAPGHIQTPVFSRHLAGVVSREQ